MPYSETNLLLNGIHSMNMANIELQSVTLYDHGFMNILHNWYVWSMILRLTKFILLLYSLHLFCHTLNGEIV